MFNLGKYYAEIDFHRGQIPPTFKNLLDGKDYF